MEPDQIHVVAAAVLRGLEQVLDTVETRFAGQIVRDVPDTNRQDRVHHDVSIVHAVTAAGLDMGARPDANAAPDPPPPDSLANALGKHHDGSSPDGNGLPPLEHPDIVLVPPGTPDLFDGLKPATAIKQFIAPGHREPGIRIAGPVHRHESVPPPVQAPEKSGFMLPGCFRSEPGTNSH
jgi:hypothetical protein